VAAYCLAKRANAKVSLLEATLMGEPWQQLARVHRTSLLLAVDEYEKNE
jgi:hypothetical protein